MQIFSNTKRALVFFIPVLVTNTVYDKNFRDLSKLFYFSTAFLWIRYAKMFLKSGINLRFNILYNFFSLLLYVKNPSPIKTFS